MKLRRQVGGRYIARARGAFVPAPKRVAVEKKVKAAAADSRDLTREVAAAGRMAAQSA